MILRSFFFIPGSGGVALNYQLSPKQLYSFPESCIFSPVSPLWRVHWLDYCQKTFAKSILHNMGPRTDMSCGYFGPIVCREPYFCSAGIVHTYFEEVDGWGARPPSKILFVFFTCPAAHGEHVCRGGAALIRRLKSSHSGTCDYALIMGERP